MAGSGGGTGAKHDHKPATREAELKITGMTCASCVKTIEGHLRRVSGVASVAINLVLERGRVTFDPSLINAQSLCEEIEDVGFDAEVMSERNIDESVQSATAVLAVRVDDIHHKPTADKAIAYIKQLPGVLGCVRARRSSHVRITYNPHLIGARQLLQRIADEGGIDGQWAPADDLQEDAKSGALGEERSLRRDFLSCLVPGGVVLVLAMLYSRHSMPRWLGREMLPGVSVCAVLMFIFATPIQFVFGRRFHIGAYKAMIHGSPNMDVLISLATNLTFGYSTLVLIISFFQHLVEPHKPKPSHAVDPAHFFDTSAVLITVVMLGKMLEGRAKRRTMEAIDSLLALQPHTATLVEGKDGDSSDGRVREIPFELIQVGDLLKVFPGGQIPVDGIKQSAGYTSVDESLITGESKAVEKAVGDVVLGGSTCLAGHVILRATQVGSSTTLGQIISLVEQAQTSKAPVQQTADKIARHFVPCVLCVAVVTWVVWFSLTFSGTVEPNLAGMATAHEAHPLSVKFMFAMRFGIAVLAIACPCALGLATPTAVMVATGMAAKCGLLVKGSLPLEVGARVKALVLDKTGTITQGRPQVVGAAILPSAVRALSSSWAGLLRRCEREDSTGGHKATPTPTPTPNTPNPFIRTETPTSRVTWLEPPSSPTLSPTPQHHHHHAHHNQHQHNSHHHRDGAHSMAHAFWWIVGSIESSSEHPLGRCLHTYCKTMTDAPLLATPSDFENLPGRGLVCVLEGRQVGAGSWVLYEDMKFAKSLKGSSAYTHQPGATRAGQAALKGWVDSEQEEGSTVIVVHVEGICLGAVALRDNLKPNVKQLIRSLKHHYDIDVWMCTGDNAKTARVVADKAGIVQSRVVAEAMPNDKVQLLHKLKNEHQHTGRYVGMVGDGVNDSPALAQADLGIAIGVGAHVTVNAADVVLMGSDLSDLASFFKLSKQTIWTIRRNFFWAFVFNVLGVPTAAGVFYPHVTIPPAVAGTLMAMSSVLVVASSLMLRRFSKVVLSPTPLTPPGSPLGRAYDGVSLTVRQVQRLVGRMKDLTPTPRGGHTSYQFLRHTSEGHESSSVVEMASAHSTSSSAATSPEELSPAAGAGHGPRGVRGGVKSEGGTPSPHNNKSNIKVIELKSTSVEGDENTPDSLI